MRQDPLCGPGRLAKLTPTIQQLANELIGPLDFRCPTIVVNTNLGYEPIFESMVNQIDAIYGRPLFHELDPP
jgi:hypothetical protein